jgi:hypothetical protein
MYIRTIKRIIRGKSCTQTQKYTTRQISSVCQIGLMQFCPHKTKSSFQYRNSIHKIVAHKGTRNKITCPQAYEFPVTMCVKRHKSGVVAKRLYCQVKVWVVLCSQFLCSEIPFFDAPSYSKLNAGYNHVWQSPQLWQNSRSDLEELLLFCENSASV